MPSVRVGPVFEDDSEEKKCQPGPDSQAEILESFQRIFIQAYSGMHHGLLDLIGSNSANHGTILEEFSFLDSLRLSPQYTLKHTPISQNVRLVPGYPMQERFSESAEL